MKKWLAAVVIAFVFVGASLYGSYQWEQRHLSSGFRRVMLALFDPSNTDADVRGYLHDARLAATTPKDRYLLTQTETMIELRVKVAEKLKLASELQSHSSDPKLAAIDSKLYDTFLKETKPYADQADNLDASIRSELNLPKEKPSSPR
jgi:hypothetical protein